MNDSETNLRKLDTLLDMAKKDIIDKNNRKLYDINKQWEKTAMYILNIAYNWNLEDLNLIHPNFPGIDLGDYERHIGVQVSTDSSPEKIRKTFNKIKDEKTLGYPILNDYHNIYFFVPGDRQESYNVTFDAGEHITFTTDHILDFNTFKDTFYDLDDAKQEAILTILNRELCKKPKYQLSATPITNCDFIEGSRQKEMREIDEKFVRSNCVFLWGLGGIGKTELAAEWGMRKENVYLVHYKKTITDTVLDMPFSGMQYIPSAQDMTEQQKKKEEFCQRLDILREYYQNATIIIDNFDDSSMTFAQMQNQSDYKDLMKLKNKFLFTTRFMVRESSIHVTEMDMDDLLKLVKQNYDLFRDDSCISSQSEKINAGTYDEILKKLILKVDKHTLTVDLMSKTLYESFGRLTPEKLLTAFEENSIDDSSMPLVRAYHNSSDSMYDLQERRIYDHLQLLFNLAELDTVHRNVMRHAVLIPMEGIPLSIFRKCHTQEEQNAIETKIFHRSWLKLDQTHSILSIHPVIREVCRKELAPDDNNCGQFLHSLRNNVNSNKDNQELVKSAADTMSNAAELLPDLSGQWNKIAGRYYRILGMYQKAIHYLTKASEIRSGCDNIGLADIYNDIGNTYTNLREFEAGISYHQKSLEICQSAPEPDNIRIAKRYNDMGVAYSYRAEEEKDIELYQKAIACYEEALNYNKQTEPVNKIHVSNALNNIGNTYSNIGKTWHDSSNYKLALQYHMDAKTMRESIPNISSHILARSYKNIGNDYANLNINDMALEYRIKALELFRKVLHEAHPELANAYQDVGNTCRLTEDYDNALTYYAEAEKIWKKQLPQNYAFLAKCQYAIGTIYSEQSSKQENMQYEKALEYYQKALDCYQKTSKPYTRQIAKCNGSIGETYLKLGKRGEAIRYLKERTDVSFHAEKGKYKLIKRYHHLGTVCKKEKRFDEALEYFCKILKIRENNFSGDVENLMEDNFQIGCIYRDLRLPQNAIPYLKKALAICNEHFPDDRKKLHRIRKTIELTNGELKKQIFNNS